MPSIRENNEFHGNAICVVRFSAILLQLDLLVIVIFPFFSSKYLQSQLTYNLIWIVFPIVNVMSYYARQSLPAHDYEIAFSLLQFIECLIIT